MSKWDKVATYRSVTILAVGEPSRHEMQRCGCADHRERYYFNGIESHYVQACDYDALLAHCKSLEAAQQNGPELGICDRLDSNGEVPHHKQMEWYKYTRLIKSLVLSEGISPRPVIGGRL